MFPYHEATKHTAERLRAGRHTLDWANMPDPFRHYEGVPLLDLPAGPPSPRMPALAVLLGAKPQLTPARGAEFLSQLLYYSASISATKVAPATGSRYALRVNPSSGNLHPTEFHFAARGLGDWPDGLYHYRVSSHMAEQRAVGDAGFNAPLTFVLASIAWREAWKYRDRAYRYCLHDIGHAWQSLALCAAALGCEARAAGAFADDELAARLALDDEWPMLVIEIGAPAVDRPATPASRPSGVPNRLSPVEIRYPSIDAVHQATKLSAPPPVQRAATPAAVAGHPPAGFEDSFGQVVRRRRSAQDFSGGSRAITLEQYRTLLAAAAQPLACDFEESIELRAFVHRVDGLAPGLYRGLEPVRPGDLRVLAAGLSLGQQLAGNSCVTFCMAADLGRLFERYGDRGYRYAHFQAGAIGQRLYLAAEALGFQATGIGAFYDDEVNGYLGLRQGVVIYHFACGYALLRIEVAAR